MARGGCPIQNAAIEADDDVAILTAPVQAAIQQWEKLIIRIIEEGKKINAIKKDTSAQQIAAVLIALLEGGLMLAHIHNNIKDLKYAVEHAETIIASIKQ